MEFSFIQHRLPVPELTQSDLEALNLVITVPTGMEKTDSSLPVFVYLHGGGFALGGNGWPQYNQARLVKLSVEQGTPAIGVGIK
jgi:carboxylesterase type B